MCWLCWQRWAFRRLEIVARKTLQDFLWSQKENGGKRWQAEAEANHPMRLW